MSQLLYGSICIEDAFANKIAQSQDGKKWICIDDLNNGAFQQGKNGKHYLGVSVWINDQLDQYGNSASISLSQTKEEREAKEKRTYIGNLKSNSPQGTAQSPGVGTHPAVGGGYPAPPPNIGGGYPPAYPQPAQQFQQPAAGGFAPPTNNGGFPF
jgi:hypothetical protein